MSARVSQHHAVASMCARETWKSNSRIRRDALHASHADVRHEHENAIKRLEAENKRLDERIHVMHVDKLDGLVDVAFFEKISSQWR